MQTADFDYTLPADRIAQMPVKPRDSSRLLVLDRDAQSWQHKHFRDIGEFLKAGDLLVVNESKVFKARLTATVIPAKAGIQPMSAGQRDRGWIPAFAGMTDKMEIFLIRPERDYWIVLAKPGRKIQVGTHLSFSDGQGAEVIEKREDGTVLIDFGKSADDVLAWTDAVGEVPVPPYVEKAPADEKEYQTVYAKSVGSVAAPTAGFHFTPELIEKLKSQGIRFAYVTLHVGIGTFRPMKTETLEEHVMHAEWIDVPDETLRAIEETKKSGGRVVAVGTTTVRALESETRHGFTNIFITPGYRFKYIDALITNFHLPKSTLLVLVSAFVGRDLVMNAYQEAIKENYRFYSFGDAMLIV